MTLSEYIKENNILKSEIHLCVSSHCYKNSDKRIMYLSLPQIINGEKHLILSERIATLTRNKRILLLDAEVVTVEGGAGLIIPKSFKKHITIEESSQLAIESLLLKELIQSDVNPGDYLAINKTDFSAKFGNYKYKTIYEKDYDEYVGVTEYPVGEKCLCPSDIQTHYLFDVSNIRNLKDAKTFISDLETIIIAYKQAGRLFSMIKNMTQRLARRHSRVGVVIQLNLPIGFIAALSPGQDNGYNPEKHLGEYYRDIEELIYDVFEGEDMSYDDGSSSYVPSLQSIENFVITALEDYYNCSLHIPHFYDDESPVFLDWLGN